MRQRAAQELGGDIDDRDDALVGHSRRADDADRADDLAVDFVGRGDDAAFVERRQSGFAADEDLDAVGASGVPRLISTIAVWAALP